MSPGINRRAALAGALAALPALAGAALVSTPSFAVAKAAASAPSFVPPLASEADDPIMALVDRAMEAHRELDAACSAMAAPEEAMFEWRENNPMPVQEKSEPNPRAALHLASGKWFDVEGGLQAPIEGGAWGDSSEATDAHKKQVALWKRREHAAKRRTGYAKTDREQGEALHRLSEACKALCEAQPISLAGLVAKAGVAHAMADDEQIALSVALDLCNFKLLNA